jgi:hypothetical protein
MAARWQYFLTGRQPELAQEGRGSLIRLHEGAPLLTAQMALASGEWALTDRMWREHYMGSDDRFTQVDAARARTVLESWVELRLFQTAPDLEAPGPDEASVRAAQQADARGDAAWRDVSTPQGAQDLEF